MHADVAFETSVSLTWSRRSRQRLAHLSVDKHLVRRVETHETNCGHLEIILDSTFSTVSIREVIPLNGQEQCKTFVGSRHHSAFDVVLGYLL